MAKTAKPNFIIVMTDQQQDSARKSRAFALDTMPFLDSFAAEGADFACAYTSNPTCMPARVSLFTGRYPSCHRVRTNHNMRDAYYTKDLLDVLREAGWRTALCGKNHSHHSPQDFDFCRRNGHLGNEGEVNSTPEEEAFAAFLRSTNHMETHIPSPGGLAVQHPYRNVSDALAFIDSCPEDQPFFAWVSFAEPHNPYQVPEGYFDLFPPSALPAPHAGKEALPGKGPSYEWLRGVWEKVLGPDIENRILRARSNYYGMLRLIDDQFRRLVEGIDARGLKENTYIIYLSDHGDYAGEYGLIRKGAGLPEVLTRIPLAIRGPGIRHKRFCECVSIVDLFPTVCDILGVPIPFGVQGRSLLPLLKGEEVPEGEFDTAYCESGFSGLYWTEKDGLTLWEEGTCDRELTRFDCLNTWTQCGQARMVRKGDWKLTCDMMGRAALFCLKEDPFEIRNRIDDPACLPVKADMLKEMAAAMMRAADPLPAPHRRYRVKIHPKGYWRDADYRCGDPGVRDFPEE